MKMSYVVDRRQIGVGFNWDRSSNRVLGTLESHRYQFAKIATKKESFNCAIVLQRIYYLWPTSGKSKQGCEEHQLGREP